MCRQKEAMRVWTECRDVSEEVVNVSGMAGDGFCSRKWWAFELVSEAMSTGA